MLYEVKITGKQVITWTGKRAGFGRCGLTAHARYREEQTYSGMKKLLTLSEADVTRNTATRLGIDVKGQVEATMTVKYTLPPGCTGKVPAPRGLWCAPTKFSHALDLWVSRPFGLQASFRKRGKDDLFDTPRDLLHRHEPDWKEVTLTRPEDLITWNPPDRPARSAPCRQNHLHKASGDSTPLLDAIRTYSRKTIVIRGVGEEVEGMGRLRHTFTATFRPLPRVFRFSVTGPGIPNPHLQGSTIVDTWEGRACGVSPFGVAWNGTWRTRESGSSWADPRASHGTWSASFAAPDQTVKPTRLWSYSGSLAEEPEEIDPGGTPSGRPERREMRVVELPRTADHPWEIRMREDRYTPTGDYIGQTVQVAPIVPGNESCSP